MGGGLSAVREDKGGADSGEFSAAEISKSSAPVYDKTDTLLKRILSEIEKMWSSVFVVVKKLRDAGKNYGLSKQKYCEERVNEVCATS
jgi:hypothetical protein